MTARHFLSALLLTACAGAPISAFAFERPFPPIAKRGEMTPANFPAIVINGKTRALTPGARIWNDDNLIEMPASLRGSGYVVNYTETDAGDIDRVWILTREEARQPAPDKAAAAAAKSSR